MLYTSKELILCRRRVLRYLRKRFKTKTASEISSEAAAASALALAQGQAQAQDQEQREKEQEEEGDDEESDSLDNKPPEGTLSSPPGQPQVGDATADLPGDCNRAEVGRRGLPVEAVLEQLLWLGTRNYPACAESAR